MQWFRTSSVPALEQPDAEQSDISYTAARAMSKGEVSKRFSHLRPEVCIYFFTDF